MSNGLAWVLSVGILVIGIMAIVGAVTLASIHAAKDCIDSGKVWVERTNFTGCIDPIMIDIK